MTNIDNISTEYYRVGAGEHCNMKVIDVMHNETNVVTNRKNVQKCRMEGTSRE